MGVEARGGWTVEVGSSSTLQSHWHFCAASPQPSAGLVSVTSLPVPARSGSAVVEAGPVSESPLTPSPPLSESKRATDDSESATREMWCIVLGGIESMEGGMQKKTTPGICTIEERKMSKTC